MQALIPRVREGEPIPQGLSYKIFDGNFWIQVCEGKDLWRLMFRRRWPWVRGEHWHHGG